MAVRLLTGLPFYVDGFAINAFESISAGSDVTDLTLGVAKNGGMSWLATVLLPRQ